MKKILEKSGKFVRGKKWEPCTCLVPVHVSVVVYSPRWTPLYSLLHHSEKALRHHRTVADSQKQIDPHGTKNLKKVECKQVAGLVIAELLLCCLCLKIAQTAPGRVLCTFFVGTVAAPQAFLKLYNLKHGDILKTTFCDPKLVCPSTCPANIGHYKDSRKRPHIGTKVPLRFVWSSR